MKQCILALICLLVLSCSATYQYPTYSVEGSDIEVKVVNNEFQLARLLRNDFNFRYDFAQYALSQPASFDWRFNRYNRYTFGYSSFWNRSQMWNDWVWGYPYSNGIGWSYSWNNNSWSSNSWNSPYGWNGWGNGYGYNAWHQIYGRQQNVANVSGRRMSIQNRQAIASIGNSRIAKSTKPVINSKPIVIKKPIKNKPWYNNNNNIKPRVYVRPTNNSRPIYNNTSIKRSSNPPTIKRKGN